MRFLLNQLKPSNEQLKSKNNGRFTEFKILLYQFLLRRLLKTYLHYAISDTVIICNGNIKIVHEYRDLGFESELLRNRIGFKSEMITHSIPVSMQKNKTARYFTFFKFKNLLSLYVDGKELFIKHDESFSIDGTIDGKLKCSSRDGLFSQSVTEVLSSCSKAQVKKDTKPKRKPDKSATSLFGRDKIISPVAHGEISRTGVEKPEGDNQPRSIEKKGFDIDTSF